MMETYDGREQETLEVLKIYPMKTLALEEKREEESFEVYDPDSMIVKVNLWRSGLTSLVEEVLLPVQLKVKKDMLMADFISLLGEKFRIEQPEKNLLV
jgi:hypothetical protein